MKFPLLPTSPYPSNLFRGQLGDKMRDLTAGGASAEMVGAVLMAIGSLLTQGIADVVWPNGMKIAIGANNWLIGFSSSGKSLVLKLLMEPIEAHLAVLGKSTSSPQCPEFLLEDATREAIVQSLHGWPIAGLFTDEAGQIKKLFKDTPTLVKLIDGSALRSARVSTGRVALLWHRFCVLFMGQPDLFDEIKGQLGANKGGVGFVNRLFVARIGGLSAGNSLHQVGLSASVKQAYERKAHALLSASIRHVENQNRERPALRLSAEATHYFLHTDSEVRRNCAPGAPWFSISEYASRHAERVLRLAGVFHVFEYGAEGEISVIPFNGQTFWGAGI